MAGWLLEVRSWWFCADLFHRICKCITNLRQGIILRKIFSGFFKSRHDFFYRISNSWLNLGRKNPFWMWRCIKDFFSTVTELIQDFTNLMRLQSEKLQEPHFFAESRVLIALPALVISLRTFNFNKRWSCGSDLLYVVRLSGCCLRHLALHFFRGRTGVRSACIAIELETVLKLSQLQV